MSRQQEDRARLAQIRADEERAKIRYATQGLDLRPGRGLNPLEECARDFVIAGIQAGRIKPTVPMLLVPAFGTSLERYHAELEAKWGDGPNGSMVVVRDHMLPEGLLPEGCELKAVTVAFSGSKADALAPKPHRIALPEDEPRRKPTGGRGGRARRKH